MKRVHSVTTDSMDLAMIANLTGRYVPATGSCTKLTWGGVAGALNCMHDQQAVIYPGVGITDPRNGNNPQPGDPSCALTNDNRNYLVADGKPPRKYIIRRLTPLECCRLQGFPDWWCDGVEGSDSAQYKMWGNGIALPCAVDVLRRIVKAYNGTKQNERRAKKHG